MTEQLDVIKDAHYQIKLQEPKLGEKLASQQLLDCILVRKVMIYCKPFDLDVIYSFMKVHKYMQENYPHIEIYVDDWVLDEITRVKEDTERCDDEEVCTADYFPNIFVNSGEKVREEIDFIITLGGDGTILWASKQFRRDHFPPLVSFAHGSLGYMCNFEFDEYPQVLDQVFSRNNCELHLDNRLRLACGVIGNPIRDVFRGNNFSEAE